MRQGRKYLTLCTALALGAAIALPLATPATAAKSPSTVRVAKAKNTLRQYTGYVVVLDKTTLTVEKRGKNTQSRVFVRHTEMKTTGEIEKDAHVTVYYREEGGRAVAHRVVVREPKGGAGDDR